MAIMNINADTSSQVLNIAASQQNKNTDKLSTGHKVNRDDTAATLSINSKAADKTGAVAENSAASMSNVRDVDAVDAMIEQARANILSTPDDSVKAQANSSTAQVMDLVQ